jgi:preprotein translocase subunit SecA
VFGFSHYDVQVEAGFYLYLGWVAEMATGEGKTLMTTLPAFARSVEKRGVHIATANAYLAERDCEECRPVFEMLGVSVAYLREKIPPVEKMKIYQSDIVYGTGYEFGFDYLRDQLSLLSEGRREFGKSFVDRVKGGNDTETPTSQKELAFVIIDEIDSVLIDEGRTPLVISGSKPGESTSPGLYRVAQTLATLLEEDEHYDLDERKRSIRLTDEGRDYVYLRKPKRLVHLFKRPWHTYVESALAARYLFRCDEHYVVDSDKIMIVDEYSGRRFEDRSWRNGLHQAVETKEGVTINEESGTQASITRQRYYRMYDRLCGMTGTAKENRSELKEVYHTDVRPIPLNKVSRREVLKDRVFVDESKKRRAVVDEIKQIHEQGRPVLIGTRTIHQSESLARALDEAGLFYRLLNAKQDKEEAEIVAIAGEAGAITIATNMAGRGTDIKISSEVEATGGLHVIGYERHESRRVDRQLLGRAGRQGNRGSGRFYCSADDYIIQYYAPELAEEWERAVANDAGELDGDLARQVDVLQGKIEQIHTRQRLELLSRDKWLEDLRKKI